MPTDAQRRHRFDTGGPWGSGLLCLGLTTVVLGISYLLVDPSQARQPLVWINQAVPIAGFGLLWIGCGVYSILAALHPPQRHADLIPTVAILSLWAAFYLTYWLWSGIVVGVWTRDWSAAVIYESFSVALICFGRCNNPPRGRESQ